MATGLRQVDLQHQELIELINALETALFSGQKREAVNALLPQLNAYVLFHFATEEALLGKVASGHAEQHRQQHHEFAERVAAWRNMADNPAADNPVDAGELVDYLNSWLVGHIMHTDRELARQVLAKG